MKNLLLIILALAFLGCRDNEDSFGVTIPPENISFRAIAGGAVMYYKLPADREIKAINIRYNDVFGDKILCSGSYACDSVTLLGFNEAQQGVRAFVTLCDHNNLESAPVEVFFDTDDSGPVAFFDNVEVLSGWGGFIVSYSAPKDARGIAHIFYVGENPLTGEPDTILVKSFPIKAGTETISIQQKQKKPVNDIVIRTEDFRGYMVKQRVWEGIAALESEKLAYPAYGFEDPENLSFEDPNWFIGYKYLFDGNTKGFLYAPATEMKFYTAGPNCLDRTLFIIDFRKPKIVADLRFYTTLWVERSFPEPWNPGALPVPFPYFGIYNSFNSLFAMLPCHLTVYASNDKNTWIEIGSFEDSPSSTYNSRWCYRTRGISWSFLINDLNIYETTDPAYLNISIPPREAFRYLRVVIHKLYKFENNSTDNTGNYTYLEELEIYTAKD